MTLTFFFLLACILKSVTLVFNSCFQNENNVKILESNANNYNVLINHDVSVCSRSSFNLIIDAKQNLVFLHAKFVESIFFFLYKDEEKRRRKILVRQNSALILFVLIYGCTRSYISSLCGSCHLFSNIASKQKCS
jgi:hypothetical protein